MQGAGTYPISPLQHFVAAWVHACCMQNKRTLTPSFGAAAHASKHLQLALCCRLPSGCAEHSATIHIQGSSLSQGWHPVISDRAGSSSRSHNCRKAGRCAGATPCTGAHAQWFKAASCMQAAEHIVRGAGSSSRDHKKDGSRSKARPCTGLATRGTIGGKLLDVLGSCAGASDRGAEVESV